MKILDIPRSGSYAGITSSKNRFGQYVRNRRSPVNPPGTGRRAFIRAAFGSASSSWASLPSADQAAWDSYANGHPYTNSLGASIILTGHQMYVAITTQLINVGLPANAAVPVSDAVFNAGVPTVVLTDAPVFTIAPPGNGTVAEFLLIAMSKPVSAGRRFNGTYWQQGFAGGDQSTAIDVAASYIAQFGTLTAGTKIFIKLTPVNEYGVTGTPTITPVVVA